MFLWKKPLDTVLHCGQVLTKLRLCRKWEEYKPYIDQNVSSSRSISVSPASWNEITQKLGTLQITRSKKTVGSFSLCRNEHHNIYVTEF